MSPIPIDTRRGVVALSPSAIREITADGVVVLHGGGGYHLDAAALKNLYRALHIARNEPWRARSA